MCCFAPVIRQTLTLQSEFGNSARYTMVSVNGELIFINVLTNALLDIGLPVINEKPQWTISVYQKFFLTDFAFQRAHKQYLIKPKSVTLFWYELVDIFNCNLSL